MRRALVLAALVLSGCMSPANRVRTARNDYDWSWTRYHNACVVSRDAWPADLVEACKAAARAGRLADTANKAAGVALGIGGSFPLQLADVKATDKAFVAAAKGLK